MLANTRKSRPTNRNLTVKNDNVLARYGITPRGYKNIMNYLENTICRGDSDILSPEELEKLEPYITFARSTLKVTVPENYIEEKQHGGVPPYEFNNDHDHNNNENENDNSNSKDVFNIFNKGRIFKEVDRINELSNAIARKKLAKIPRERYREELVRDRNEWDNSITRRTVYGVLTMAQILNDVYGVKRKIDAAVSELQAHDRFCEAYPQRFLTQKQYKNAHRLWKLTGHHPPLDTGAALKEYVLKKGGKEAELLLKQLIRAHSEFRPRPSQEIEQEIRDRIRIPSNEVNVAHRYPSAVEEYVTGRWNGMVERIRELHPDATRDAVYAVATKCLYQELNEFSQHHSGEQLAIAPPIRDEFLQPHSNGHLTNVSPIHDQFLKPHLNGQFVNGQFVIYNWPLDVVYSIIRGVSTIFSKSDTPGPTPGPTLTSKQEPNSVKKLVIIHNPDELPSLPESEENRIMTVNTIVEAFRPINRIQGAWGRSGQSALTALGSTQKGLTDSNGMIASVGIGIGDLHFKTQEEEKCKQTCTIESGCLNIDGTKYETDPTSRKLIPGSTGMISFMEEIARLTGKSVNIGTESIVGDGLSEYMGTNYTAVGKPEKDSALSDTVTVGLNCIAKPLFEQAVREGHQNSVTLCNLSPNIHFHMMDQRYNNTNIDSIHSGFIKVLSEMLLQLKTEKKEHSKIIINHYLTHFLNKYNKEGITREDFFTYLKLLYNKNNKMKDLFNHPTFKKYSATYLRFSKLPQKVQDGTLNEMKDQPLSFMPGKKNGVREEILLKIIGDLEQNNYEALYTYLLDPSLKVNIDFTINYKDSKLVNFQQLMPDLETIRMFMTSGSAIPLAQFGAAHINRISYILIKNGWFKEIVSYKRRNFEQKCADRSTPSGHVVPSSSLSFSKKTSMMSPPNFYSSPSAVARGKLVTVGLPNPNMLEQEAMYREQFRLQHPPPAYPEAAASHDNPNMLEQAAARHVEYRLPSNSSSGKLQAAASPNFYSSPSAVARGKLEEVATSPIVQNNNNFQTKLTRHRTRTNEIIDRHKRSSDSIDPIQFPEQYRKPLGYGRRIVRGLADLVIPGPSYPQAPSYPQLENGWFRRLHTREFKNLTEEEKKYIDSLSWKKMGDLTEEERAYLRYKGIINPYEYSSNPPPMYVLQNQKRKEEQTNLTERLERKKASSGITGWFKGMIGRAPPTLRPSRRQKQNPKQGGTRRKQKRSNLTRRIKCQSKPVYPSCK